MSVLDIPNLEAAYLLNETSGTTATDSSGNGNDGTYARDASNTHISVSGLGAVTDAQDFNGTSDLATLGSAVSFTGAYTVAFWAKRVYDSTFDFVLGHSSENTKLGFQNNIQNAVFLRLRPSGASETVAVGVDTTAWHHYAMGRDASGNGFLYVDGVAKTVTLSGQTGTANFDQIGKDELPGNLHQGSVARVYLFSRVLESWERAEIQAEGPLSQLDVGRVGHFKLEETAGTNVADSSPAGNDGTASEDMSGLTAPGVSGRGVLMDGTQHILAPYATGFGSYPFSMGCAFKHDGTAAVRALMSIADADAGNVYWQLQLTNTADLFVVRRNTTQVSTTTFESPDTNWHTALAVFPDATSAIVYLDGAEVRNSTSLTSVAATSAAVDMLIGDFRTTDVGSQMIGNLDEASFWTRALSAAEAAEWHQFTIFPLAARHSAEPLGLETSLSL